MGMTQSYSFSEKEKNSINFKGGKHLSGILFETLMYGKEQYEKRKAYEAE